MKAIVIYKAFISLFLFTFICVPFSACKKDKTDYNDKYYTDLHDTLISVHWAGGGKDYNLDLD